MEGYNMNRKHFIVAAKCGHVGRGKYIRINFAVKAKNGREAAHITRNFPRVKHHHKKAILNVREVKYEDYIEQLNKNNKDPYLKSGNKQEQTRKCKNIEERIIEQKIEIEEDYEVKRQRRINYLLKKRQIDQRIILS